MSVIDQMTAIPVALKIEVRLVAFEGQGQRRIEIPEAMMTRYLRALRADMDTVVLEPWPEIVVSTAKCNPALCAALTVAA